MINENSSIKQQFIQHITEMNIKPLKEVLVKNVFKQYSNTSFLEKLNEIFNELKSKGNTSLNRYKGRGVCSCNKDKNVFCFVGNKTKDYFTLSYQENENEYYSFSKSCAEVVYNEKLELNEFYYFSIKPEDTLEYKKHQKYAIPLQEYKSFIAQNKCKMEAIELWLKKYNHFYTNAVKDVNNKVDLLVDKEFEVLYGKLSILSLLYQKETYFKEQINTYNKVKDSVSKLEQWFNFQYKNKDKYQLFSSVFYDSRELSHFKLKLDELTLNPTDFKYTLQFMNIIEDSKSITFNGTIKTIYDIEVFSKTNTARAYKKQIIVLSIDDFCCSEYQVTFTDGRIKHLENLIEGQYVKVFARLTGGQIENEEYKHRLYGWRVEKLATNPTIKENKKEKELYYKYILPLPF